jgi:hypothetical protein
MAGAHNQEGAEDAHTTQGASATATATAHIRFAGPKVSTRLPTEGYWVGGNCR